MYFSTREENESANLLVFNLSQIRSSPKFYVCSFLSANLLWMLYWEWFLNNVLVSGEYYNSFMLSQGFILSLTFGRWRFMFVSFNLYFLSEDFPAFDKIINGINFMFYAKKKINLFCWKMCSAVQRFIFLRLGDERTAKWT